MSNNGRERINKWKKKDYGKSFFILDTIKILIQLLYYCKTQEIYICFICLAPTYNKKAIRIMKNMKFKYCIRSRTDTLCTCFKNSWNAV